jgi:hypothetical protein
MRERNGVRVGQRVRDLDGNYLGRVKELYDWGFSVVRGFPILFWKDVVLRYDEVRGVRDGELVAARSDTDLFAQALGEIPPAWRIPAPSEYPRAATPSEARSLFSALAAPRPPPPPRELPPQSVAALAASRGESLIWRPEDEERAELGPGEERAAVESRNQDLHAPAHH